ncbi:MAG: transglutaminase domain-containing protein [Alkalilacustris sp.]
MLIRVGCHLQFSLPQPTPLIAMLSTHHSRYGDLVRADDLVASPRVPFQGYRDGFGNWCTRMVAPAGAFVLSADGVFRDDGQPEPRPYAPRDFAAWMEVYLDGGWRVFDPETTPRASVVSLSPAAATPPICR